MKPHGGSPGTLPAMTETALGPAKTLTTWSVIAAIFFPTGLAALFQSGKPYAANQTGDYARARSAAAAVRKWQNISAICFVVVFILNLVFGGIWSA